MTIVRRMVGPFDYIVYEFFIKKKKRIFWWNIIICYEVIINITENDGSSGSDNISIHNYFGELEEMAEIQAMLVYRCMLYLKLIQVYVL